MQSLLKVSNPLWQNWRGKRFRFVSCFYVCDPRFEETPEGLDIELASVDKEEIAHSFSNGDMVEVIEGELQNLQGKVNKIQNLRFSSFLHGCFLGDCN